MIALETEDSLKTPKKLF